MRHLLIIPAFLLAFFAFDAQAQALSCQRRVVSHGDSAAQVLALCGEPIQRTTRLEQTTRVVQGRGPTAAVTNLVTVTSQIDVWVYDFGPRRLMRELTFRDGHLRNIRSLSYGRRASAVRSHRDTLALASSALWRRELA